MEILKKMNRWIKWIVKTARVYRQNPNLVDAVIKSQNPEEAFEDFYEEDLNKKLLEEYPSKDIFYKGRTLRGQNKRVNIPVQLLITKEDPRIKRDLKKWGFWDSKEDYETLIPKVYKKIFTEYFSYQYDKNAWGISEFWEFPFEMFEKGFKKGYDCDSWAHFIVSYLRALIPAGKVWVVVGDCKLGGHSTVYVYSDKDQRFHHLNSTYGSIYKKISKYPTHDDAENGKDNLGIYDVWLSFNDVCSRSEFENKKIGKILIK